MPIALFQIQFCHSAIDADKGVISGVAIMKLGALAQFAGPNGEVKRIAITDAHISALLSHVGNRAIPMHLTHDWTDSIGKPNEATVEMAARIGALKSFRRNEVGDLVADAYLKSGPHRDDILFGAEHNPENNMFSAVFGYAKNDPLCIPRDFRAADLVPQGAATMALFSRFEQNTNMDKTAFLEMLKDPEVIAAFSALIPKPIEVDTAALAKSVDDAVTAALANHKPKLSEDEEVALLKKAEASIVSHIGSLPAIRNLNENKDKVTATARFNGLVKQLTDSGVGEGAAVLAVMKKHEPEYVAMQVEKGIFKAA